MTHHKRYPPETRQQAQHLHQQGHTPSEIAAQLRVPYATVYRWTSKTYAQNAREQSRRYKESRKRNCRECGKQIWMSSVLCHTCASKRRRRWNKTSIIEAINRFHQQHGRPPIATEWARGGPDWPNPGTVIQRYGTWADAIEAAGHPRPHVGRKVVDHSPERDKAKQLHKQGMTVEQLADMFHLTPSTIRNYLKSSERTMTPHGQRAHTKNKKRNREQRIADLRKALSQPHNQ